MDKYKEMYDGLSDEMKAKVKECRTSEELIALAKTEGIELTDEQLDAISGGSYNWVCSSLEDCPEKQRMI